MIVNNQAIEELIKNPPLEEVFTDPLMELLWQKIQDIDFEVHAHRLPEMEKDNIHGYCLPDESIHLFNLSRKRDYWISLSQCRDCESKVILRACGLDPFFMVWLDRSSVEEELPRCIDEIVDLVSQAETEEGDDSHVNSSS